MRSLVLSLAAVLYPLDSTAFLLGPETTLEILLNRKMADLRNMGSLGSSFDVAPNRLVLVSDPSRMYLVGWGGVARVDDSSGGWSSFSYTRDGVLFAVRGRQLYAMGHSGDMEKMFELPEEGMGISTSANDSMFLFSQTGTARKHGIYEILNGRQVRLLLDSPAPIDSVARLGSDVVFATAGSVYSFSMGGRMRLLLAKTGAKGIRSVSSDDLDIVLYFSDGDSVCGFANGKVWRITSACGGSLRTRDGAVFVLNHSRSLLVRLARSKYGRRS